MNKDLFAEFSRLEQDQRADQGAWLELEAGYGQRVYQDLVYMLTRKRLDVTEAKRHWLGILDHRLEMEAALGRSVGLRGALCDYFINIEPAISDPILVEGGMFDQSEQSALRDELTGLYNRRFFNSVMEKQTAEYQRYGYPFSMLMIDVDHFKDYNDTMGHLAGDKVLYQLARVLESSARGIDYLIRFGGEEFAVILPRCDKDQAQAAAERHRQAVETHVFPRQEQLDSGNLTVSVGAACFPGDALDGYDLVHRADMALYAAKRSGRNKVTVSGPERRQAPRVAFSAEVGLRVQGADSAYLHGETMDISMGGLRVATENQVDQGRPVELLLYAKTQDNQVHLIGQAVNLFHIPLSQFPFQLGIKVNDEGVQPLGDLVQEHMKALH